METEIRNNELEDGEVDSNPIVTNDDNYQLPNFNNIEMVGSALLTRFNTAICIF